MIMRGFMRRRRIGNQRILLYNYRLNIGFFPIAPHLPVTHGLEKQEMIFIYEIRTGAGLSYA
jgi:hypothetical protein